MAYIKYGFLAAVLLVVTILVVSAPAKESIQEWRPAVVPEKPPIDIEKPVGNVNFTAWPTSGAASEAMPLQVLFSSGTPGAEGWQVDFGDGTFGILEYPVCIALPHEPGECNPIVVHYYSTAGTYIAKLSDPADGSLRTLATVTIQITTSTEVPI